LRERGLGEAAPEVMAFVDAYSDTVGVERPERADTIRANCLDLNSISIATTRLQERMGRKGILLALDSLTSPYLLSGAEVIRFVRLFLSKFAGEGNSVLALMDEGCGKEEDLGAMMSIADGILKMEVKESSRTLNVVKHPKAETIKIDVPIEPKEPQTRPPVYWDPDILAKFLNAYMLRGKPVRKETGDFVNLFWPNLIHWSCMLWDPKGFPTMLYEMNKYESSSMGEESAWPWNFRILYKALRASQSLGFIPKSFSKVKDMKKGLKLLPFRSVGL